MDSQKKRFHSLLKEHFEEIDATAHLLINKGWLNCFFWEYDSDANPVNFIPNFTEQGKSNLFAVYRAWKNSGLKSMEDMELKKNPFISELGQPMTDEKLGALSILAAVCVKMSDNTNP
jgi:hypothetical protein